MNRRFAVLGALLLGANACAHVLDPDTTKAAARVSIKPGAMGGMSSPGWGPGLPVPISPALTSCAHDKAQVEAGLGLTPAEACGTLRAGPVPQAIGNGDAPVGTSYAPYCYSAGGIILAIEYETSGRDCTRVVGISLVAKR